MIREYTVVVTVTPVDAAADLSAATALQLPILSKVYYRNPVDTLSWRMNLLLLLLLLILSKVDPVDTLSWRMTVLLLLSV